MYAKDRDHTYSFCSTFSSSVENVGLEVNVESYHNRLGELFQTASVKIEDEGKEENSNMGLEISAMNLSEEQLLRPGRLMNQTALSNSSVSSVQNDMEPLLRPGRFINQTDVSNMSFSTVQNDVLLRPGRLRNQTALSNSSVSSAQNDTEPFLRPGRLMNQTAGSYSSFSAVQNNVLLRPGRLRNQAALSNSSVSSVQNDTDPLLRPGRLMNQTAPSDSSFSAVVQNSAIKSINLTNTKKKRKRKKILAKTSQDANNIYILKNVPREQPSCSNAKSKVTSEKTAECVIGVMRQNGVKKYIVQWTDGTTQPITEDQMTDDVKKLVESYLKEELVEIQQKKSISVSLSDDSVDSEKNNILKFKSQQKCAIEEMSFFKNNFEEFAIDVKISI